MCVCEGGARVYVGGNMCDGEEYVYVCVCVGCMCMRYKFMERTTKEEWERRGGEAMK